MQGDFRKDDKALGRDGEALAASFLEGKGYRVLARNYRCRLGEVDLIVSKGGGITFVEVKTRRSVDGVSPRELVNLSKQRHISKVAQHYFTCHRLTDVNADFAVLTIDFSRDSPQFEWIPNAFDLAWGY